MSRPTKVIFIILSLVLIISLYYNFSLSGQIRQLKDPQAFAQNQIAKIVSEVGKVISLPQNETPTVATVSDLAPLKSQPFFTNAAIGDQVLIYAIARKVILKDGRNVAEMPAGSAKITDIEQLMVGHEVSADRYLEEYQHEPQAAEVLRVDELRVEGQFEPLDFSLRKGEIVGLIGLIGSGKEAVRDCLTGIRRADGGDIYLEGVKISPGNPHQSIRLGIGHVPIERRSQGLATGMSVQDNINLLVLKSLRRGGLLTRKVGRRNAQRWVERCRIKTPSLDVLSGTLSGGNQQKVVIAKWIGAGTRFLILDHPTRGVDVGAKEEIYHLIRDLAQEGIAILIMCDTLEEDIGLSNRILLMKEGRLIKEMAAPPNAKPTPSDIIKFIV